jgi:cysteine desulfurase/selenocysteine lyase
MDNLRKDFPIFNREPHPGKRLIYLDSAATSQKPESVIRVMDEYYRNYNANIHRGVHTLAEEATTLYEGARSKIASFIGAHNQAELVFTRNTTESINLVAATWGRANLRNGDTIILTEMEHHSNLVPWQILAKDIKLNLEFIPVTSNGLLDMDAYDQLLKLEPKLVSFTHVSNVLGTINPVKELIKRARQAGAITLVDAAQSAPHLPVNIGEIQPDFLVFSAHKMLGPTGIGVLWGREELLEKMPPYMGGGDMIKKVYLRTFTTNDLPHKFEAGTPAIAEAIGFGAAIDYLDSVGMEKIAAHEKILNAYAVSRLSGFPGIKFYGPDTEEKCGVVTFTLEGIHPHDIAQILDSEGIAVRAGHHCAMPLHDKYGIPASTRASFYLYNTQSDIDQLVFGLEKVNKLFG